MLWTVMVDCGLLEEPEAPVGPATFVELSPYVAVTVTYVFSVVVTVTSVVHSVVESELLAALPYVSIDDALLDGAGIGDTQTVGTSLGDPAGAEYPPVGATTPVPYPVPVVPH